MNIRRYASFGFALVFALLSSVSVSHFLQNRESVSIAKTPEGLVPVVVAARDMGMGMKLTEQDLEIRQWPKEAVQSGNYYQSVKQVIGRVLRSSLVATEPVTDAKLMREGENISMLIPEGMRALTISIRRSNTLTRVLERGSIVDVVAIIGNDARMNTKVIAQEARVLAVDNPPEAGGVSKENPDNRMMEVMLLVTPRDADWIVYARNQGTVDLVLRNERAEMAAV